MKNTSKNTTIPTNPPMVLIIEGCDLSGKSTLTEALSKKFPGIVMKITARPRLKDKGQIANLKRYYYSVLDYINRFYQSKTVILDRFFPSEVVYSLVKRGYDGFSDEEYRDMEKVILHRKHLLIYCDPGEETILERLKVRGDDYMVEEDIHSLLGRYDSFLSKTKLTYIRLDTRKPVEELLEEVKLHLPI